jgi:hypothetical protein
VAGPTWGQTAQTCVSAASQLSEAQKASRKGEDKINDCGNLSHNTANDFQWSINTSMAFFFFRKKKKEREKGVEGKIRMFMLTYLFTYVWFSAALA